MDDPSIADLLEAIRLVAVLTKTISQHEKAIIEAFERLGRLEQRIAAVEARAA
jgi:hypothetical protein